MELGYERAKLTRLFHAQHIRDNGTQNTLARTHLRVPRAYEHVGARL